MNAKIVYILINLILTPIFSQVVVLKHVKS